MMHKKYRRLSFDERIEIEKLLSHKRTYTDIAATLGRNKSSPLREIVKQGKDCYKAMHGEALAVGWVSSRRGGKNRLKQNPLLRNYVLEKLSLR